MLEFIFYFIFEVVISLIFEVIILEFFGALIGLNFKMVYMIGIIILKLITRNDHDINTLARQKKDSSLPYLLGFSFLVGIGILIVILVQ